MEGHVWPEEGRLPHTRSEINMKTERVSNHEPQQYEAEPLSHQNITVAIEFLRKNNVKCYRPLSLCNMMNNIYMLDVMD
jgi:hypothetical protein